MGRGAYHPVERLVAVRTEYDGERSFKARWVGFGPKHDTWVSQSDLNDDPATFALSPSVARVLGVSKSKKEDDKKASDGGKGGEEPKATGSTKNNEKKADKKTDKKVETKADGKATEKAKAGDAETGQDVGDAKRKGLRTEAMEVDGGENETEAAAEGGEMKQPEKGQNEISGAGTNKKGGKKKADASPKESDQKDEADGEEAASGDDVQMEDVADEPETQPNTRGRKRSVKEAGAEEQAGGSGGVDNSPSASAAEEGSIRRSSRIRTSMKRLVEEMDATPRPTPKRRRKTSTPEGPRKKSGKDSGEFWAVERILGSRGKGATREFKIRWKGFSWRFDTWVVEKDLEEPPLMYPMALPLKRKLKGEARRKSV